MHVIGGLTTRHREFTCQDGRMRHRCKIDVQRQKLSVKGNLKKITYHTKAEKDHQPAVY